MAYTCFLAAEWRPFPSGDGTSGALSGPILARVATPVLCCCGTDRIRGRPLALHPLSEGSERVRAIARAHAADLCVPVASQLLRHHALAGPLRDARAPAQAHRSGRSPGSSAAR